MDSALNITERFSVKYPIANMIFPNKTLILVTKQRHGSSSSQQMALLAGMAFVGGIVAGLLIRCIYKGLVKYFISSMDQLAVSRRSDRGNTNPSFVDDNFRHANDEPPDYLTVVTETSENSLSQHQGGNKTVDEQQESKVPEEMPPAYVSVVPDLCRVVRSATT